MDRDGLDPEDWEAFRAEAHGLLDLCIDRLRDARDYPWQLMSREAIPHLALSGEGHGEIAASRRIAREILPYHTGNTHPRFWGWVHGTGLAQGLLSEIVATTMNSNAGGRDHAATYVERAVIDWARRVIGFPDTASGVLVTGTSQATVVALMSARTRALGASSRAEGVQGAPLVAYAGAGVHSSSAKAMELLGLGSRALRRIPESDTGMDMNVLRAAIARDKAESLRPFAVIGTAGSVDMGRFDDLETLAQIAQAEGLWFHVDGAFGAWTRLADAPWRHLSDGIERADSLACDFHKWLSVPYDCGLALIREEVDQRAAFAARPAYLEGQSAGLAGAEPWFCDYGVDLSRGNRALKVWMAVESLGEVRLGAAITMNCRQAARMGALIEDTPGLCLMAAVVSNICVFTAAESLSPEEQSALNTRISHELQLSGKAVFSTTKVKGITCLRAAFVNHRTRDHDLTEALKAVVEARDALKLSGVL
ncbi:pyridoxal phosphate-dependent decarboxylase family protein [Celeribacter persicus]|uniref:Glutamate/tyrosine decarboxylase-like PLP-dependent enzyme n=1 Tax=Celeribacter persicus TaxID=1651082 RepID=A0A2T5HVE3_9RHOB|nr:pyridoxal-dependent decarboxylase [Celeribacter persicus]PTQ75531.1 glutamate/tyrosine decarboxylase-like PLP-dependent enzyme [Celeribacter persicus]